MITCGTCKHFERDKVGDGNGIGTCKHPKGRQDKTLKTLEPHFNPYTKKIEHSAPMRATKGVEAPPEKGYVERLPLYPNVERTCRGYHGR